MQFGAEVRQFRVNLEETTVHMCEADCDLRELCIDLRKLNAHLFAKSAELKSHIGLGGQIFDGVCEIGLRYDLMPIKGRNRLH